MINKVLIVDLETDSKDSASANISVFGAYDPSTTDFFIYKWNDDSRIKVLELIKSYDFFITFNGGLFDSPILEKHGITIDKSKHIDLKYVIKNVRGWLIRRQGFKSYSLDNIISELGLDIIGKGSINYDLFKKKSWTLEEQKEIIKYLKQDLILTAKLWAYLLKRFESYALLLNDKDVKKYKHITTDVDLYIYKAICNLSRVKDEYNQRPPVAEYPKKYVSNPRKEIVIGNTVMFKFKNLYTNTIIQFNLLSSQCRCCPSTITDGKFHGKNFYEVQGFYCQKNQGAFEKALLKLEEESLINESLKPIKELIYSRMYNVISEPKYYSTFTHEAVIDCDKLAKQIIKNIVKAFDSKGYFVVYVENDNFFITIDSDKGQSLEGLIKIKDEVITRLKSKMPFPLKDFDLKFSNYIKVLKFFRDEWVPFPRKNEYVYITDEGFVGSKNVSPEVIKEVVERYN